MNIILSRKGFDSSYGGIPSPVIVENGDIRNGKIISLPIPLSGKETPSASYNITYDQLNLHDINYFDLIDGLTKNKESLKDIKQRLVHLDPDINKEVYDGERADDWQPIFGQSGAAQGHLNKESVGKESDGKRDIFLFFGWFAFVEKTEEGFIRMKKPGSRAMMESFHMLWGWMQIEDKIELYDENEPRIPNLNNPKIKEWMRYHPHLNYDSPFLNTLFIGSKDLVLGSEVFEGLGCGTFSNYKEDLMLTIQGSPRRTEWLIPDVFEKKLTYHSQKSWGEKSGDKIHLKSASIGQEFVHHNANDDAIEWIKQLILQ